MNGEIGRLMGRIETVAGITMATVYFAEERNIYWWT